MRISRLSIHPPASRESYSGSTEDAFEALYTEYGLLLRTIAMRRYHIPPDDAEALVHDIFMAYLERRTYIRDVKGWLIGAIGSESFKVHV